MVHSTKSRETPYTTKPDAMGYTYTYIRITPYDDDEKVIYPDPLEMDKPWKDKRKPKFMKRNKNRRK